MTNREKPNESTLDLDQVTLTGRTLRFTTEARRGLAFTFDGRFLRDGDLRRFSGKQIPVVAGVARRLMNGKTTAEGRMQFYCFEGAG